MSTDKTTVNGFRARLKKMLDRDGLRWLRRGLMALSVVLAGPKAAPDAELRSALDRPGLRWLLSWLLQRSTAIKARGVTGVVYRDGAWFHRFDDVYVHVEIPGASLPTPDQLDEQTRDTWEHHYTPQPGDIVVDAGAGTGTEVLRWSRLLGEAGRVIAIEAHPRTFGVLSGFCSLNKLTNVELHNVALSDAPGTIEIDEAEGHVAASTVTEGGTVAVPAVTLSELLAQSSVTDVAFLKMNIEGAEVPALHGFTTSTTRVHNACISCHDFRADRGHGEVFRTRAAVVRQLEALGFQVEAQSADDRPWVRDQVNLLRTGPASGAR